ncbi:hypothetical protein ACSNOI_41715 [Actinomadura kijaniata]|uniref:hypothetical protein n=1 Tax=Actinomadura kijaniata TaxID=46161 RepID=UPI003F1BAB06
MSQNPNDPAGTTQQFENFARQTPQQPVKTSGVNVGLVIGVVAVVAVVAIAAIAFMMV